MWHVITVDTLYAGATARIPAEDTSIGQLCIIDHVRHVGHGVVILARRIATGERITRTLPRDAPISREV